MFLLLTLILILTLLISIFMRYKYSYWSARGVSGPKPTFFFGNVKDMLTLKKHGGEVFMDIYNETKSKPFVGIYMMFKPTVVINDLDLIKTILVKDFMSFTDHLLKLDPKYEPLGENLFNVEGEQWKKMRNKLSPTFTTNKIKYMFDTLNECTKDINTHLDDVTARNKVVDVKELLANFGMNVIGSCAFGVHCNSFVDKDFKLFKSGNTLLKLNAIQGIFNLTLFFCLPELAKNIKFSLIGKETNDYFHNLIKDTIDYRRKNNIQRNDFLQILMRLQEHGKVDDEEHSVDDGIKLTAMQISAQAFVFFVAGFDTTSTTSSFALYELALNPEIQKTLREEIQSELEKSNGKITYEGLQNMSYLGMVIEETLRKYPPVPVLFRRCTKRFLLPDTNVHIEAGIPVMIPIMAIQRDPQYFPDPEKFDPERFTPENKASRHHFSYLPFGEGPRICIGNRFALVQTKLSLVNILSRYNVSVCDKTKIPIEYNNKTFTLSANKGLWLSLTKI